MVIHGDQRKESEDAAKLEGREHIIRDHVHSSSSPAATATTSEDAKGVFLLLASLSPSTLLLLVRRQRAQ